MNYFDLYPDVELPSFSDKRRSSFDFIKIKNLFKRGKIRDDIYGAVTAFSKYTVLDGERPDTVARKLYDDEQLDWVVLISNNIINVQDEWPMGQYEFERYLDNKYSKEQLSEIHHYETKEIRYGDKLLLQAGLTVDSDFTFKYSTPDGFNQSVNSVESISYLKYEIDKNDAKRTINVLRKKYIGTIINDMRDIMTYTDSSQYINRKLKKGDNVRIAEPR
tara:strand:- start:32 stop:688 length:657 start_codon:yes stop_codon:yes gene_type:complete